jgi:hypothetical protein
MHIVKLGNFSSIAYSSTSRKGGVKYRPPNINLFKE